MEMFHVQFNDVTDVRPDDIQVSIPSDHSPMTIHHVDMTPVTLEFRVTAYGLRL